MYYCLALRASPVQTAPHRYSRFRMMKRWQRWRQSRQFSTRYRQCRRCCVRLDSCTDTAAPRAPGRCFFLIVTCPGRCRSVISSRSRPLLIFTSAAMASRPGAATLANSAATTDSRLTTHSPHISILCSECRTKYQHGGLLMCGNNERTQVRSWGSAGRNSIRPFFCRTA